jgi:hypothetical protein
MTRHQYMRLVVLAWVGVCAGRVSAAPPPREIEVLMRSVGARIVEYYRRAQTVICVAQSTVQPIRADWGPAGFSRTVISDLRVESEAAEGENPARATVIRDIRRINGRAPRDRDKKDRTGCTDPNPLSPEPLAFLLPGHRDEYRFTSIREGREKDRAAFIIDFVSTNRTSRLELIEDEGGHDDCFDWSGPVATSGRVWVDAKTHDVLRVDRHMDGPADVRVPWRLQRQYNLEPRIVIERDDQTLRYTAMAFPDPDELMLLPDSIESLTLIRGGLQSVRRLERFSGYRRFLTASRVVKDT